MEDENDEEELNSLNGNDNINNIEEKKIEINDKTK